MEPKAVRQGYEPPPFFFAQTNESGDSRLVAWAPSLAALRHAFEALIKALPVSVEVLLKIRADTEGDHSPEARDQVWERYHGVVAQGALLEAMSRCYEFVFQDSCNQLCVRDPVSFDYVVLDDVGVVYVYSDAVMFRQVFVRSGFEERIEPLISEEPYWTQTPKGGREQQDEFLRLLQLSPVPGPDEPRTRGTLH